MEAPGREGRLEETPLPRLLLAFARSGASGAVLVERGGRQRAALLLAAGQPLRCTLEPEGPGLTDLLVERGHLDAGAAPRVRSTMAKRSCAEEAALLGLKLVGPRELVEALRELVVRRLLALARWEHGAWRLDPGATIPPGSDALRVDPVPVVQQMLLAWRPDRMLADLAARGGSYPEPGDGFAAAASRLRGDAAAALAEGLDGSRDLWGVLGGVGDVGRVAALWVLDALGTLRWRADAAAGEAGGAEQPDDAGAAGTSPQWEIEIQVAGAADPDTAAHRGPARARDADAGARDDRAAELRKEILARHAQLDRVDLYALLGVEAEANPGQIKRAYLKAAKTFHPDVLARLDLDDVKEQANEVFARITRAHGVLSDPTQRREYDAGRDGGALDADRIAQAESLFRKAELLMKMGNFAGALELARGAVGLWPEDPAYQMALGWCLFKKTPPDEARARTHLEKSLRLEPRDAVAHFRLGVVLRALGEAAAADEHTARARQLDPNVRG